MKMAARSVRGVVCHAMREGVRVSYSRYKKCAPQRVKCVRFGHALRTCVLRTLRTWCPQKQVRNIKCASRYYRYGIFLRLALGILRTSWLKSVMSARLKPRAPRARSITDFGLWLSTT